MTLGLALDGIGVGVSYGVGFGDEFRFGYQLKRPKLARWMGTVRLVWSGDADLPRTRVAISGERVSLRLAVIEDEIWDLSFSYRKTSELRSRWTESGHGHGGIESAWCRSRSGSRQTLSLVRLFSPSPTVNNGRWVSTEFSFKRK